MTDDPKNRFQESLLSQEQPFSSTRYQEYQAMLEQKLIAAEQSIRRSHIETAIIFGTAVAFGFCSWFAERRFDLIPHSIQILLGCIGFRGLPSSIEAASDHSVTSSMTAAPSNWFATNRAMHSSSN